MAYKNNINRNHSQSWFSSIGNKVKNAAEIAGAVKGIYDTGRMLYNAAQYIGPAVAAAGVIL
jgi:hypothetical protein